MARALTVVLMCLIATGDPVWQSVCLSTYHVAALCSALCKNGCMDQGPILDEDAGMWAEGALYYMGIPPHSPTVTVWRKKICPFMLWEGKEIRCGHC